MLCEQMSVFAGLFASSSELCSSHPVFCVVFFRHYATRQRRTSNFRSEDYSKKLPQDLVLSGPHQLHTIRLHLPNFQPGEIFDNRHNLGMS